METPLLSQFATVDRHIESFVVAGRRARYLHTSPEFAMKRLLCAGSGAIWQLCKVFRAEESGRHHNAEFSLLEWYRPGFDLFRLMDEVSELVAAVGGPPPPYERISYVEAFQRHAGFDPLRVSMADLRALPQAEAVAATSDRDTLLDLWMSHRVGPCLGRECPCFVYGFPASQAALAQVVNGVAQRFELFWDGLELANGFHELRDAEEQRQRFAAEQRWRSEQGLTAPPYDAHLIDALSAGLPDCAGVALGIDRLLMRLTGAESMADVLAFPDPIA